MVDYSCANEPRILLVAACLTQATNVENEALYISHNQGIYLETKNISLNWQLRPIM